MTGLCDIKPMTPEEKVHKDILDVKKEELKKLDESVTMKKAIDILTSGKPMELFQSAYSHNHNGDDEILRGIIYATALQNSKTTHGLQIYITGSKGKGKTNAVKSAITLLPPATVINSSFSDKSLFVRLGTRLKPVLFIDDTGLSDYQNQTIKRAMTNFQEPTEYTTLDKENKILIRQIPPRTLWLGTSVAQSGDDQLQDRFLNIGIVPDPDDDKNYVAWEIQRRKEGRAEIEINEDVKLARAIIEHLRDHEFIVIGFDKIRFKYDGDRRLINICLDLVEASAIIHYLQRKHEERDGVIIVHPEQADLNAALDFSMFRMTDETAEGRLTRSERALDDKIQEYIGKSLQIELTEREIVDIYGKTHNAVRVLLYGREGTQHTITGGLLEKCPWYRLDRQEMTNGRTGQSVIVVSKHQSIKMSECTNFAVLESSLESAT